MSVVCGKISFMSALPYAAKPMFDISPADGAVGATANFVRRCRDDFAELTRAFVTRAGLPG
jgi:hypothetical protein